MSTSVIKPTNAVTGEEEGVITPGVTEGEENIHKFSISYDDYATQAADNAKKKKEQAITDAGATLNTANINAESQYRQSRATYGAKAEQLASMGLTGSGYSDYLDGKAYEQLNASKIAAQSEHNTAVRAANDTYDSKMDEIKKGYLEWAETSKENQRTLGNTLLEMSMTGDYTEDFLKAYAKNNGYTGSMGDDDELWAQITKTNETNRTNAFTSTTNEYKSTLFDEETGTLNYKISDFTDAVESGQITEENKNTLIEAGRDMFIDSIAKTILESTGKRSSSIKDGVIQRIEAEAVNGTLTSDHANKLKQVFENVVVASNVTYNGNSYNPMDYISDFRVEDDFSLAYTDESGTEQKIYIQVANRRNKAYFDELSETVPTEDKKIFGYKGKIYMVNVENGVPVYLELEDRPALMAGWFRDKDAAVEAREETNHEHGLNILYRLIYGNAANLKEAFAKQENTTQENTTQENTTQENTTLP